MVNTFTERRNFLKLGSLTLGGLAYRPFRQAAFKTYDSDPRTVENVPFLELHDLPNWVNEIFEKKPWANLSNEGILQFNGHNVLTQPSYWNRTNTEHAKRYSDTYLFESKPKGIVLHFAANTEGWDRKYAPNGSAAEFARIIGIDLKGDSAAFIIGDKQFQNEDTMMDALSVVQTEVPYNGRWTESAHALYKQYEASGGPNNNTFLQITDQLTEKYGLLQAEKRAGGYYRYRNATVTQTMSAKAATVESIPNRETLGIEVLGYGFNKTENYPKPQKIANTLATLIALGEKYGIPGFNLIGHYELDNTRGDPGVEFLYQMKLLYGLSALIEGNQPIASSTFGPFSQAEFVVDQYLDYFNFIDEMLKLSLTDKDNSYYEIYERLQIDQIKGAVYNASRKSKQNSSLFQAV